jgi:hypothetical protein
MARKLLHQRKPERLSFMGMHFGILAARCPLSLLEAELAPLGVSAGDDILSDDDLPEELIAGERQGRSYIVDPMFELSAHGDFVRSLSERLRTLVVGCGAETVSGTYWVFAAEDGQALRSYWSCAFDLAIAFDEGDWCRDLELQAADGSGMFALLRRAGFDYDDFFERAPKRELHSPLELVLPNGPLHARLERHRDTHRLLAADASAPHLLLRDFDGALLDFDLTPAGEPAPLPPSPLASSEARPWIRHDPVAEVASVDTTSAAAAPLDLRRSPRPLWLYGIAVGCALMWLALRLLWS